MKRKLAWVLMLIGLACLLLAGGLLLWYRHVDARAGAMARSVSEQLQVQLQEQAAQRPTAPSSAAAVSMGVQALPAWDAEMPAVEIDGDYYIGELLIPAIELSLPVMSQWSESKLKTAPCRYTGSVYSDDLIIAGHNYQSHLGKLGNLAVGDAVRFSALDGNTYEYIVSEIDTIGTGEVEKMLDGDWDLTVFTCTFGGKQRITIRCVTSG